MRIISGTYKGRYLKYPKNIRPITQKDKKILISTLMHDIPGAKLLDLYAGSGQIGIEAISNGADQVVFVESSQSNCQQIMENMDRCGIPNKKVKVECQSAKSFINSSNDKYDIIIIDPPHFDVHWKDLVELNKLCRFNTILVIKFNANHPPPEFSSFQLVKTKGAKDNLMNFYLKQ